MHTKHSTHTCIQHACKQTYVRGVIEQKLDIFVPISHQPRDLVSDIIADVSAKFPEFASCARKRIRTFLKSYRRSKKLKEGNSPATNGINKVRPKLKSHGGMFILFPQIFYFPNDKVPLLVEIVCDYHLSTHALNVCTHTHNLCMHFHSHTHTLYHPLRTHTHTFTDG